MRILLTGADGMLGTALTDALRTDTRTADGVLRRVSLADFDIADESATVAAVTEFGPDVVVHAAADAVVDDCERNPGRAVAVNVGGVHNVARACLLAGSRLVYVSSDYVFDGSDPPAGGYREGDLPNPRSVYGLTKLGGESITALLPGHLIVRTSWLFGGADERVDVVLRSVRRARLGEPVELIADQYSLPTYTADLARAMVFLLVHGVTGTVHVANAGRASWYEVVRYALGLDATSPVRGPEPVPLDGYPFVGRRPRDSTLNTDRLAGLGHPMPHWKDAVRRYLDVLAQAETASR